MTMTIPTESTRSVPARPTARATLHRRLVTLLGAAALVAGGVGIGLAAPDPVFAPAGVPRILAYEGTLTSNGAPVTDNAVNMQFRLYDAASSGNLLWQEDHAASNANAVNVVNGRFSVELGRISGQAIDPADFAEGNVYLEIWVNGSAMERQRVVSTPYALRAETAEAASGALDTRIASVEAGARTFGFCWNADGSQQAARGHVTPTISRRQAGLYDVDLSPPVPAETPCSCSVQSPSFLERHINSHRTVGRIEVLVSDGSAAAADAGGCCVCADL